MEVTTIGIDLAKSAFAVSGADGSGRVGNAAATTAGADTQLHAWAAAVHGGDGGQRRSAVVAPPLG